MNRRKAIFSMFLIGGGAAAGYSGYKWFNLVKTPDLAYLDQHKAVIADLAEVIIPRTNTPGAKDAKCEDFIIKLLKESSGRKTQNSFIDGLKDLNDYTNSNYKKAFTALAMPQQIEVVTHFRDKGKNFSGIVGKAKNKFLGKSFFAILKEYTTIAFSTSKTGATETLAYELVPGRFNGCMPLLPNQKSWATK